MSKEIQEPVKQLEAQVAELSQALKQTQRQLRITEEALAETQTLYRIGRVLAGAADLQEIIAEALVEFVYGLGLDQGGVVLVSPAYTTGQLVAYMEEGKLQTPDKLHFPLDPHQPALKSLLNGVAFVSTDVPHDLRIDPLLTFNRKKTIKASLQAPMIVRGEIIGWIGVEAVEGKRRFSQRQIDLARAMADQIAITIQNRRLLEQAERRADRLKAVAIFGEAITRLTELDEILYTAVDLIRDRFGFYHASIFLLDEARQWAVVRASTGEVGKIMVQRPHKLGVGSNSIVGYVTHHAQPRIALDVGQDAVWFDNPLLPETRSEMALPLLSRGQVIGALDVQSTVPAAFAAEDIEIVQIMADQLSAALENARLYQKSRESQGFMKAIIDQIPDPIFIKDRAHRWVVVNTAFAQGLLGRPEEQVLYRSDPDFLPEEESRGFWAEDDKMFNSGQTQETEGTITTHTGEERILFTRKVPLTLTQGETRPEFLVGIINDITNQKQQMAERERLIEETRRTLERTRTLHRISDTLATSSDPRLTYETVLGEYLKLLGLTQGSLMLIDKATNTNRAHARFINGQPVTPRLVLPAEHDPASQYLRQLPQPLIIENAQNHPLVKQVVRMRDHRDIKSMLFIPLLVRQEFVGSLIIDVVEEGYTFNANDIDIGEAIADQLTIWLENRRLLVEAKARTELLQTAAEVSRAASSILDIHELIQTSVNLIRDRFDFYYVGLFMVDETSEWAVLRAGTGQAGQIQLAKGHRLKVGGESMIGWCVQHRQARIAADVGEDAVWFSNPDLPYTHSEMALPLVSHDQVIGALTVQSTERSAFSEEDVTMLQTMADQLANAIDNARLFESVASARQVAEASLQEVQALQHLSQALSGTLRVDDVAAAFFESCSQLLGFDRLVLALVDQRQERIQAVAGHNVSPHSLASLNYPLAEPNLWTHVVNTGELKMVAPRQPAEGLRVLAPITLRQQQLGVVEAGFKAGRGEMLSDAQQRLLRAFVSQMALALESAQRYETAEKSAQREAIIRQITAKIRSAVTIDDILKATVSELSKVVGASTANISLGVFSPPAAEPDNASNVETQMQNGKDGRND